MLNSVFLLLMFDFPIHIRRKFNLLYIKAIHMKYVLFNIGISLIMLACFLAPCGSELVNAQQSVSLSKIIEENAANQYKKAHNIFPRNPVVEVMYQSTTTLLLQGPLIVQVNVQHQEFNSYIWSAMDLLKSQYGLKLQHVFTSEAGNVANGTDIYILMTK